MANPEHVAKLKEGAIPWNEWREKDVDTRPNLVKADLNALKLRWVNLRRTELFRAELHQTELTRADLSEANLEGADLIGANLIGANLIDANLQEANLAGANLHTAQLSGARLAGANLRGANLTGVDLFRADLSEANLTEAKVIRANLSRAYLDRTILAGLDLSDTHQLDKCSHDGPSVIDHRTLAISGPLPVQFLRGCGLSDWQIEEAKLLNPNLAHIEVSDIQCRVFELRAARPIQLYSLFISYASKDEKFTERLHRDLQEADVRCWYAPEHMKTGDLIEDRVASEIRERDKLLLVLSEASIMSAWVAREVREALEQENVSGRTVLFPVRLDDAVKSSTEQWAHDIKRNRHIGDFTNWKDHDAYKKAFDRLLRDLKVEGADDAGS